MGLHAVSLRNWLRPAAQFTGDITRPEPAANAEHDTGQSRLMQRIVRPQTVMLLGQAAIYLSPVAHNMVCQT